MSAHPITLTADLVIEGLGAFDCLEVLGRGTYGTTFRAVRGDDEYAIKVIHLPELAHHLWDREIAALEAVEHPNVVRFRRRGSFQAQGSRFLYLECEYIDGGTVRAAIDRGEGPPSPEDLRAFLTGQLAGVQEIHDLGIHHRDIKPANIALRHGDLGEPVLLDFGLAKVVGMSSYTVYPQMVGTAAYMAPEQLAGKRARSRSDLFAVGVVTYEAGTGTHPFIEPGNTITHQGLYNRIQEGPRDPRLAVESWPDDVAKVVLRLMSFHGHARLGVERALQDLEEVG